MRVLNYYNGLRATGLIISLHRSSTKFHHLPWLVFLNIKEVSLPHYRCYIFTFFIAEVVIPLLTNIVY
jgi:hypothetical protein